MPASSYTRIDDRLRAEGLEILGGFHPSGEDAAVPPEIETLLLLGPHEPGFWAGVADSPEWCDGGPDPLDRWSARVIGAVARRLGATALFPFTGPPWLPFLTWAARTGRAWPSPVGLLVHDRAGLWVSFRGALALRERIALPAPPEAAPCATCDGRPCLAACPAAALTGAGYDLAACHGFLDTAPGADCMRQGCAVRGACPISQDYGRLAAQSAYHMRRFHP